MLMNNKFKSIFKKELYNFIIYKKSLGYDYNQEIRIVKKLDLNILKLHINSKNISKNNFFKLSSCHTSSVTTYKRYYCVLKDFCIFLISQGYKNIYYETKKFHITNNYVPIVFNESEIYKLFNTMNKYNFDNFNKKMDTKYYMYSIALRLCYACGLRVSEVLNIKYNNINIDDNSIKIIDSKKHTSRLIFFSNSIKKCLLNYFNKFNINEGLIFEINNNKINIDSLRKYYKRILQLSNLNMNCKIHNLRHSFANNAFNQLLNNGYDENVALIYLYKYMGHKTITETIYYLHFTDYNRSKLLKINDNFSKELYKGVI